MNAAEIEEAMSELAAAQFARAEFAFDFLLGNNPESERGEGLFGGG